MAETKPKVEVLDGAFSLDLVLGSLLCKELQGKQAGMGKKKISHVRMAANRQFQNRMSSVHAGIGSKNQYSWQKRKEPLRVLI